jgi:hypothetical protein
MSISARLEQLFLFLGVIFYLLVFPHGIHGDAFVRFQGLQNLLKTGTPLPIAYSYVGPIISAPLLLMGKFFKDGYWWISRFNVFLFFFTSYFFHRRISEKFGAGSARIFVLLFMCAGMFARHTTDYYSEVLSSCFAAMSLWLLAEGKGFRSAAFGIPSAWNTPGTLFAFCLPQVFATLRFRKFRYLAIVAMAAAGVFLENKWKYGEFYPHVYLSTHGLKNALPFSGRPGFSYPLWFGVLSVLFSFGKGLIFFTPGLFALWTPWVKKEKHWDEFIRYSLFYVAGLILVFARWWCWSGDWFWGPRFYLFASFLSVCGLHSLLRSDWQLNAARASSVLFLLTLSVWVSAQGIAFGTDDLEYCSTQGGQIDYICHYVPEFSPLWRAFVVEDRGVNGKQLAFLIFHGLVYLYLSFPLWKKVLGSLLASSIAHARRLALPREWGW